jgi:hypothetical protein
MRAVEEFTRKHYWYALFVLIASLKLLYAPLASEDLFIWVASGLKMIDIGQFISQDYFTVHHNLVFSYPAQLSNLFYGLIFRLGGSSLLFVWLRMLGVFFVIFIYKKYLNQIEKNIWNLLLAISFIFGVFYMIDRPQYLAFFPAVMTFCFLDKKLENIKDKFFFFALVIFWSNVHSSVLILLPILITRFFVEWSLKRYSDLKQSLIKIILFLVGICMTPIGLNIFTYFYSTFVLSSGRFTGEWRGLLFYHDKMFVGLMLILIFYLFFKLRKNGKFKNYLLTGYFILPIMTLVSVRHAVFFCLINFIVFSKFELWISGKNILKSSFSTILLSLMLAISLFLLFLNWKENQFLDEHYDRAMIHYLKTEKNLRIYHDVDGGLLSVFLYQNNNKYFIDARNIIFSDEMYRDYAALKSGREILEMIRKYDFDTFIIRKQNDLIIKTLNEMGWVKKFEGDKTVLFKKRA